MSTRMSFDILLVRLPIFVHSASSISYVAAFVFTCILYFRWSRSPLARLSYPPGPPPSRWISGNLSDAPLEKAWEHYAELSKQYGDLVHLRIYGQHNIIVNSLEASNELFEKRSNVYSDRPRVPMIDLMGWGFNAGLKPYGDEWRRQRRIFQQSFKPDASLAYRSIQVKKVNDMLYGLLTSPDDFRSHFRTVAAAIIMSAVYGHDISPVNDYYVGLAETAVAKLSESIFPGASAVNAIPTLRYLPGWFPGAGFQHFASTVKELTNQMLNGPIEMVKKKIAEGTITPCLASELLEECRSEEEFNDIKEVSATSYAAGADTTVSSIGTFFYVMAKFPEELKKAQDEIDSVVGVDRMPSYEDRNSLPHVEAVFREVLRWMPALPLGVSHSASDDDVYNGYHIPKGTTIIPNTWAMAHDLRKYQQPELFNPSRFFNDDGDLNNDDMFYVFGSGRRICPGRHLASATVWLTIVTVLALFDIRKKKDASGNEIPIDTGFTNGLVVHPIPYECSITPRSDKARQLILEAVLGSA